MISLEEKGLYNVLTNILFDIGGVYGLVSNFYFSFNGQGKTTLLISESYYKEYSKSSLGMGNYQLFNQYESDMIYITQLIKYLKENEYILIYTTSATNRLGIPFEGERYYSYDELDPTLQKDIYETNNMKFFVLPKLFELRNNKFKDSEKLHFESQTKEQRDNKLLSFFALIISIISTIFSSIIGYIQINKTDEMKISKDSNIKISIEKEDLDKLLMSNEKTIEAIKEKKTIKIKNKVIIRQDY